MALQLLLVLVGGALGGTARFFLSGLVGRRIGETFPWGTLVVNVSGCFLMGLLSARIGDETLRAFVLVGVLGGYTTVSSFSLQTVALASDGEWRRAGLNVAGSVVLCLFAVTAGSLLAGALP